jgi:hypothetical protein
MRLWRRKLRILYLSVHEILEYDDLRMLRGLGHRVFSLGAYFVGNNRQLYRPPLFWSRDDRAMLARFYSAGCQWHGCLRLTPDFVREFDLVIVMHDPDLLERHWDALSVRTVIWRTIGQDLVGLESRLAALRARGLRIFRYSESERNIPHNLGSDGVFRAATPGLDLVLGGSDNEGLPGAVGKVDHQTQKKLLRESRVYFYCAGLNIPYTLNFIEAWMTGIPVVAVAESAMPQCQGYSEIPALIRHGENGFIAQNQTEASSILRRLLAEPDLAARIGAAGRRTAVQLFGNATVAAQWRNALSRVTNLRNARNRPEHIWIS